MSRPSKVMVSPHNYDIIEDDKLRTVANATGFCGPDSLTIVIDPNNAQGVQRETILHEVMHATWTQTALDSKYSDEKEEEIIYSLAPRLLAFLRDNKELVRWLIR